MALPPKFAGQLLASSSHSEAKHTLELYLDYVCPFSAKMFKTFYDSIRPLIEKKYTKPGVRVIFRQQIQPWRKFSCDAPRTLSRGGLVFDFHLRKYCDIGSARCNMTFNFVLCRIVTDSDS
jgi:hypothetical protein